MNQTFSTNPEEVRQLTRDGMVLLKNDGILPLSIGLSIAPIGRACFNTYCTGGGSAFVKTAYTRTVADGLKKKEELGKIKLSKTAMQMDGSPEAYTDQVLNDIGIEAETVVYTIGRFSEEGSDRPKSPSQNADRSFYLSDDEKALLKRLEVCDSIRHIIILLNVPAVTDLSFLDHCTKIAAVMVIWYPGMEGGDACADLLCGDAYPSGRLTDTWADCEDYPSTVSFTESDRHIRYEDDLFVGYRYFETFKEAKERVVFPFGYGLNYTDFTWSTPDLFESATDLTVQITVKNTGHFAGREIVQVYASAPNGRLFKPSLCLVSFAKTHELQPGEAQIVTLSFKKTALACFDDENATGHIGCYVLEPGSYRIFVGKNVRDITDCGQYTVEELTVVKECGLKLSASLDRRLSDVDKTVPYCLTPVEKPAAAKVKTAFTEPIMLQDVTSGKATMQDFMSQLTDRELIDLSSAQPPSIPRGTAGIGNLRRYGVPNAQTSDGPNGIRRSTPTTCFPCASLLASSWDEAVWEKTGYLIGREGLAIGVDILLAPGLNIHRNPLCGRNFEYFSEDPLISGKAAAAYVRGVQKSGMLATIKHLCCNNKETNRYYSDSLLSERAFREIYLKGFEIAVKEGEPAFVMTSYNLVNGLRPCENHNLLQGVLRDEWGFEGAVMTDWRVPSRHWREISAGNNIKMPYGYPEELDLTAEKVRLGTLTRADIERNVEPILWAVTKTMRFRNGDMGRTVHLQDDTLIKAVNLTAVSSTGCGEEACQDTDGGTNLCALGKDNGGHDAFVLYDVSNEQDGQYTLQIRAASPYNTSYLEVFVDDIKVGECHLPDADPDQTVKEAYQNWITLTLPGVAIKEGLHTLKILITTQERDQGINLNWLRLIKES